MTNSVKIDPNLVSVRFTAAESSPNKVQFCSKKIIATLLCITAALVIASVYGDYLELHSAPGNHFVANYMDMFYLAHENNLPTLFSTCMLFFAAALNFLIYFIVAGTKNKKVRWYWLALGFMFIFLGLDEMLAFHDRLSHFKSIDSFSEKSDFFYYVWVVPYLFAVLITGVLFLRFVLSLPPNIRNRFIVSGVVYVTAALGFEFVESYVHVHNALPGVSIVERILYTVEETLEMVGVILFVHALLDYISLLNTSFTVGRTAAPHNSAVLREKIS